MKTEFERILREKIKQKPFEESNNDPSNPPDLEPLHLAFLLGTLGKRASLPKRNNSYFQTKATNKSTISYSQIAPPVIPTPPDYLSIRQKEGWLWFWKRGAPLSENYTKVELQRQFRKLARVLHPDQNPHPKAAESFIILREHYDNLLF